MHEKAWTTLSSKEIYDNPWIHVRENQVTNPSGGQSLYGLIHFKNKSAAAIPLDEEGNTWIVGQHRYSLNEYSWEIPMGGYPADGDSLEGAKRELKEETGITAQDWQLLTRIHTSNSVTDEEGFIYLARDLSFGETEFDDTEDLTVKKLPIIEAIDMALNGEITDAISLAGLLKIHALKLRGDI